MKKVKFVLWNCGLLCYTHWTQSVFDVCSIGVTTEVCRGVKASSLWN